MIPFPLIRKLDLPAIVAILLTVLSIIAYYGSLPAELPRHFGGSDNLPTAYASKAILFLLPAVSISLYAFMGWAGNKVASSSKWSNQQPKPGHEAEVIKLNQQLLAYLRMIICWTLFYITWASIQIGLGNWAGLGKMFDLVFFVLVFGPLGFFAWRIARLSE